MSNFNFPFNNENDFIPQGTDGPPLSPPPSFTPSKPKNSNDINIKSVDPGSIKFCKRKFTYLWLNNGNSFWAYITYVGKKSISGFRWFRYRWVYFGIDLRKIDGFTCY